MDESKSISVTIIMMEMSNIKLEGNGAVFSTERHYRYALWRVWNADNGIVMFIGLNPSTANERDNDPTIRRVMSFAYDWGFGGVVMANIYGWITPYPLELQACEYPIGENDQWVEALAKHCQKIVFAWGKFKQAAKWSQVLIEMFPDAYALKINNDGTPRHPLYVPGKIIPVKFKQ
jgi:hypothetical protein